MNAIEILEKHKLKRTSCRVGIIDVIIKAKQALSENEIREQMSGIYNRTTFYRSFITLEKHKIIHKIVVDNQLVKYALEDSLCDNEMHAHFYCNKCETVKCIDVPVQRYNLPDGFSDVETEVLIKGTCVKCEE